MPIDAASEGKGTDGKDTVGNGAERKDAAVAAGVDLESLPTLYRDPACWGFTAAQFCGAFNDSTFKQLVLLLAVDVVVAPGGASANYQWVAQAAFAVPFVLLSGWAGVLADRASKRTIMVLCRAAEILITLGGMAALAGASRGMPWGPIFVLGLMGVHSTIFGPAKYGILPEIVRSRDLPRFNGLILMTTFVALVLGPALAGFLMVQFRGQLWKAGSVCWIIAVIGWLSSLAVRRTPPANPQARFSLSSLAGDQATWRLLRTDRALLQALLVYSVFWFVGAVVLVSINALGRRQLGLDEQQTSFMVASISLGIAFGCGLAGKLSAGRVNFALVRIGAAGLVACLVLLSLPGKPHSHGHGHFLGQTGSHVVLALAGGFTGLFAVPIQVFLQARPPDALKGRMIGTMNLFNWIGIIASAGFDFLCQTILAALGWPASVEFAAAALMMLPVALFYRPRDALLQ